MSAMRSLTAREETELLLVDLGSGQCRLGGSALAQVYGHLGDSAPDVNVERLKSFFEAVQALRKEYLSPELDQNYAG